MRANDEGDRCVAAGSDANATRTNERREVDGIHIIEEGERQVLNGRRSRLRREGGAGSDTTAPASFLVADVRSSHSYYVVVSVCSQREVFCTYCCVTFERGVDVMVWSVGWGSDGA